MTTRSPSDADQRRETNADLAREKGESARRTAFRESDIIKAVRGIRKAGGICREIVIGPNGEIRILVAANSEEGPTCDAADEIAGHFARKAARRDAA